jgi:outer membrane exchange protein TraA
MAALVAMLLVGLTAMPAASQPQPLPPVIVEGEPVAPSPGSTGTGLCMSSRVSTNVTTDFPQSTATFTGGITTFLETAPNAGNPNVRFTQVLRTPLDLSNNNVAPDTAEQVSYGDFAGTMLAWGCKQGGCDFFRNDTKTAFASRMRGYLNVTPEMVGRVLHFGIYTDDAASLVIFDRGAKFYEVLVRPPQLGAATWRTTNSVTFRKPGLYPVEILYAEISEYAALEVSVLIGDFVDFEQQAGDNPVNLRSSGFTVLEPARFFQTESGRPSYPDPNQCQQCRRQFMNTAGNNGCDPSYYCNGAALCAPCDSATFCGPSCSPCGASTPLCHNRNGIFTCVQCTEDDQCPNGRCDTTTNECRGCRTDANCPKGEYCGTDNECHECTTDDHCPRGQVCADNSCQPCSTQDSCAGSSCNCCPGGLKCASAAPGASPTCVECTSDTECSDGKRCDVANGRCVETVAECNTSERCGSQCVKCPSDRPMCLDGQVCVECRSDLECGDGKFCVSGECASCTTDKRCGTRCEACPGEQPFCLTDGTARGSSCVGCLQNEDCGPGGTCDPITRQCSASTCSVSCTEGTLCHGNACVQCFADAHCPCGGTCDTATNTCTTSCDASDDCLGVQHCSATTQQCERGRRKPGTEPQGGGFCCDTTSDSSDGTPGALALLLLVAAFLALRPRRAA